jgi:hypothetical protein
MPADKSKPDKPRKYQRPPRRKNRFNEREYARACRAAKAVEASGVSVDPKTGVYTITFSDKADVAGNDLDQWMKDRNARATEGNS